MSTPYYTEPKVRAEIDEVLHECAKIFQNLGVSSTKKERTEAKAEERRLLKSVRSLDPKFIDLLLINE